MTLQYFTTVAQKLRRIIFGNGDITIDAKSCIKILPQTFNQGMIFGRLKNAQSQTPSKSTPCLLLWKKNLKITIE